MKIINEEIDPTDHELLKLLKNNKSLYLIWNLKGKEIARFKRVI